jgi:hypothetical protein
VQLLDHGIEFLALLDVRGEAALILGKRRARLCFDAPGVVGVKLALRGFPFGVAA